MQKCVPRCAFNTLLPKANDHGGGAGRAKLQHREPESLNHHAEGCAAQRNSCRGLLDEPELNYFVAVSLAASVRPANTDLGCGGGSRLPHVSPWLTSAPFRSRFKWHL